MNLVCHCADALHAVALQLEEDEKDHLKREAEADDERRKIFEGELVRLYPTVCDAYS